MKYFLLTVLLLSAVCLNAAEVTFNLNSPGAKEVYLAGSFNDWQSYDIKLKNAGNNWSVAIDLEPGTYEYKFIIDGAWREDPNNSSTKLDGFGGNNSLCTVAEGEDVLVMGGGSATDIVVQEVSAAGHTFSYNAGSSVGSCFVAGEFNDWSTSSTPMADDGNGVYTTTVDLSSGSYMYKFVVDGNWIADPENQNSADDGFGGLNSLITIGDSAPATTTTAPTSSGSIDVTFNYTPVISGVSGIYLAGDFNGWSDSSDKMSDDDNDGTYTVTMALTPGSHTYKFVVDGNWQTDPANSNIEPDGLGGDNSLINVREGKDPFAAASSSDSNDDAGMKVVPFQCNANGGKDVFLAGSFNDWNDSRDRMRDSNEDGIFTTTLLLQPGSYEYKFVVDGNWKQDPDNSETAEDGFGGNNSLIVVDDKFSSIEIEIGDDSVFTDGIEIAMDYSTCNPLSLTTVELTAYAHKGDIQQMSVNYSVDGSDFKVAEMSPADSDPLYQYYNNTIELPSAESELNFFFTYTDGNEVVNLGTAGFGSSDPFKYTKEILPPFLTPEWARTGIVYQIFPERFNNGDKTNDPDFSEKWYQGRNSLPSSGKTNGEYFHMVDDWTDSAGLAKSPYRTDGKPDYFSFFGGDIEGVNQKLDYLQDLGITVIYFNPLNQGMSNHKYDPTDYMKLDPHFGTPEEFKSFMKNAHDHGIRVVVDMAFNHTGNWHFAFEDCVEKGDKSEYWSWYEWKKWPLPKHDNYNAIDYYDCWWGFGLHPNLNWDLSCQNAAENNKTDISQADPNMPVVNHVLDVARYWLGELDIDGFRLDVPNEVPFWFWKMFNDVCHEVNPDCWLVGELWGNAASWIGPHCFDSTMNYKYFRDPVMDFFGKGRIDAVSFDSRLAPGRYAYPAQSVGCMMNLIDSHDTIRYLTSTGDVRRLKSAVLFGMTYVGMPHIWYGNEVGMTGGKDPDCRRPMDWNYEADNRKVELREYYGRITRFRRDHKVLSLGDFQTVITDGKLYGYARRLDADCAFTLLNAG
ncbi:hypothetical protein HOD41_04155, partial [bacterium]|nr:hypothetical protein [bacterium]